jgi:trimethylamine--corrinoid protein Co-methyltransferase
VRTYEAAGAEVDNTNRVKIPAALVHSALEKCIPKFSLFYRNADTEVIFGDGLTKHNLSGWTREILDWRTNEHRTATESDLVESMRIIGALDEVEWARAPLICTEWKPDEIELQQYKHGIEHSNKPLLLSASNSEAVEKIVHLGSFLAGGQKQLAEKPNFAISVGIMSPLILPHNICEVIVACAKRDIPICFYTSSMVGASTPVTLSATIACNHAEIIAATLLAKIINPDARILYLNYSKPFDMQCADISSGSPEFGLLAAAQYQAGKYIGIPSGAGMFYTNSPQLDIQAGFEKLGGALLSSVGGVDFSCGMGCLANAGVHSLEALILDAELVDYTNRLLRGINCDEEHLGFEIFEEIEPLGDFLSSRHTLKFFRNELIQSKVAYRGSYASWSAGGKTGSIRNNIRTYIEQTLDNYQSPGLTHTFIDEYNKIKGTKK